jgi:hypothetical protein
MERLNQRIFGVSLLLAIMGVAIWLTPEHKLAGRTEQWMEQQAPESIDAFKYSPSVDNPKQSYRMDQETYDKLAPFGIVCRQYQDRNEAYDVVLIASSNRGSFHDPRVCFTGQGWKLESQKKVFIPTKDRGTIPAMLLASEGESGTQGRYALYFYRGPGGFFSSTVQIKLDLFRYLLKNPLKGTGEGVFYRFIALRSGTTEAQFLGFVGRYMDVANKSSNGYF